VKILFIFHEAHLTGASLALFGNVKWFSENTDISMSFLLKENGILKNEISRIGKVYHWEKANITNKNIFIKVLNRIFKSLFQKILLVRLKKQKFDIIYANTVLCSDIIEKMADFSCKMVWHIHELELAIKCIGEDHLKAEKYVHYIIANSKSTKTNLVRHGINENKILVHYPFIDIKKIQSSTIPFSLKESLKIPADSFIIGSSGSGTDRKGIQDFIRLPIMIDYLFPENKFCYLWVGKIFNKEIIEYDLEKSGVKSKMFFSGEQRDPFPFYKIFDIFVSCSKEESFGLSALEAAALHKPLICFKNTGGIEEITEQAGNVTVLYLNLIEMSKAIIEIYGDSQAMLKLGNHAFETAMKYDIERIMPDMYKFLKQIQNPIPVIEN
jgi:glycosyltransferase involved in cell wall biosynthesis